MVFGSYSSPLLINGRQVVPAVCLGCFFGAYGPSTSLYERIRNYLSDALFCLARSVSSFFLSELQATSTVKASLILS